MFNEHPLLLTARGLKSPCAPLWTVPQVFFSHAAVLRHLAQVRTVGSRYFELRAAF